MSERPLAYVERVFSKKPIANADKIECIGVLGWELVAKKDEFEVGDLCVYFEIDSLLPDIAYFEFMRERKFRIKTVKLRGQCSQGLAIPLTDLPQINHTLNISKLKVGDDLTEVLGIRKYETPDEKAEREAEERGHQKLSWTHRRWNWLKWKLTGKKPAKSSFPSDVPKTDEIRVQKMGGLLHDKVDTLCYISEKLEGQSFTAIFKTARGGWISRLVGYNHIFLACSRTQVKWNNQKGGDANHAITYLARKYDLENKMKKLNRDLAIQGEAIGVHRENRGAIQGNIYRLNDYDLRVFSIFDIDKKVYVGYEELIGLCQEMELPTVPILETRHTLVDDIKYYVELSKGKSKLNKSVEREGIVCRSLDSSFSFKSVSPSYLLKQD